MKDNSLARWFGEKMSMAIHFSDSTVVPSNPSLDSCKALEKGASEFLASLGTATASDCENVCRKMPRCSHYGFGDCQRLCALSTSCFKFLTGTADVVSYGAI